MRHLPALFLLLLFLSACAPDPEMIASTANAEAVAAVEATIDARPPATPLPTATPYPTAPPPATAAPLLTHTPFPTATPYPTQTPYPTPEVISPTLAATASPVATIAPPADDDAGESGASTVDQLLAAARLQLDLAIGMRDAAGSGRETVACQVWIDNHAGFLASVVTIDDSDQPNDVRESYADYRGAVEIVSSDDDVLALVDDCRRVLDSGDAIPTRNPGIIDTSDRVDEAVMLLTRALERLGAGEG